MQYPHEKVFNPLVPSLLIEAIQDRLRSYDGTRLSALGEEYDKEAVDPGETVLGSFRCVVADADGK